MQSDSARGCSMISFCMKCVYGPLATATGSMETRCGASATSAPSRSRIVVPAALIRAHCPLASGCTSVVWGSRAGTSLATNISPSPTPSTMPPALPSRAA